MAFFCVMNWKEECDGCGGCMTAGTAAAREDGR